MTLARSRSNSMVSLSPRAPSSCRTRTTPAKAHTVRDRSRAFFVRPLQLRCRRGAHLQPLQHLSSHYTCWPCHVRALRSWTIQKPRRQWRLRKAVKYALRGRRLLLVQLRVHNAWQEYPAIKRCRGAPPVLQVSSVRMWGWRCARHSRLAVARASCSPGAFKDCEMLAGASCSAGFFGFCLWADGVP